MEKPTDNGWTKWAQFVLKTLERHETCHEATDGEIESFKEQLTIIKEKPPIVFKALEKLEAYHEATDGEIEKIKEQLAIIKEMLRGQTAGRNWLNKRMAVVFAGAMVALAVLNIILIIFFK